MKISDIYRVLFVKTQHKIKQGYSSHLNSSGVLWPLLVSQTASTGSHGSAATAVAFSGDAHSCCAIAGKPVFFRYSSFPWCASGRREKWGSDDEQREGEEPLLSRIFRQGALLCLRTHRHRRPQPFEYEIVRYSSKLWRISVKRLTEGLILSHSSPSSDIRVVLVRGNPRDRAQDPAGVLWREVTLEEP